ncbi:MAG: MetQ/NlpA family ABC transporter substrate-binding protein [Sulfitobacter litoralis]|jgi:D-methionine transport system substrate-binding protein|uniref:D-methionine transport system substrate-binding protein n=1 Tax=Sulfitobacter litoralis TaxID=335975 RepID=A0ABY0T028_9RHOB|nr:MULTISPECIES: MetQ/NlpA family ABC transporter substrate-binding protein [Sulfitobacter]MBQ0715964.1 MetQ/NlpA family ABC transporter substrate-binding protein [Sulfitobacter litoralis]MBQ0766542.1 MetQ/NlpA family ABC transporter substrate-binding protein [Sulfitobacter litoralis]MBQ0801659.1 MetQ/NlpA family ABC transporter substrate-binding protein [Sulfitobacter litoralis]MCF7726586.1 MetQ/NlpA family lipoprotein [Sulfitobacter sp. M22]MCF7777928.1 MetQ/NlpA family lipoprotein [Sulfitob
MLRLVTLTSTLALMATSLMAEQIKVGVSPGEHAEIMEEVARVAEPMGLEIDVIEFSDYVVPNQALADGDIEANSFQHVPYLEAQMKDRGFALAVVGNTITTPMGVYSDKITDIANLEEGATFGIPNDPTNGGRALLVLQQLGMIKVDPEAGLVPTVLDIIENPKDLSFKELDAAQLPRSLADLDAALINTNYAIASGLSPKEDSIAMESADNPYVNVIAVQKGNEDAPWVKTLLEAYHSDEIKAFIDESYHGTVITSW